jgi:hypothetical protein
MSIRLKVRVFDYRDSERLAYYRGGSTLACGRFGVVLLEGVVPAAGDSSESSSIPAEQPIGIIAGDPVEGFDARGVVAVRREWRRGSPGGDRV